MNDNPPPLDAAEIPRPKMNLSSESRRPPRLWPIQGKLTDVSFDLNEESYQKILKDIPGFSDLYDFSPQSDGFSIGIRYPASARFKRPKFADGEDACTARIYVTFATPDHEKGESRNPLSISAEVYLLYFADPFTKEIERTPKALPPDFTPFRVKGPASFQWKSGHYWYDPKIRSIQNSRGVLVPLDRIVLESFGLHMAGVMPIRGFVFRVRRILCSILLGLTGIPAKISDWILRTVYEYKNETLDDDARALIGRRHLSSIAKPSDNTCALVSYLPHKLFHVTGGVGALFISVWLLPYLFYWYFLNTTPEEYFPDAVPFAIFSGAILIVINKVGPLLCVVTANIFTRVKWRFSNPHPRKLTCFYV